MEHLAQLSDLIGMKGQWNAAGTVFKTDTLSYGYLSPIQKIEVEGQGLYMISCPITNTEWWHQFMPVSGCPRLKGQWIEIKDRFDPFCRAAQCDEACGAEDQFVDLSAGRFRVDEDREFLNQRFPRLGFFLERAEKLTQEISRQTGCGILLDTSSSVLDLRARFIGSDENIQKFAQAFKALYAEITRLQGKVSTAWLPQPEDYSDVKISEESVLAEARFYALQEAVRQESLDMLNFLVQKKGGQIIENEYYLPVEQVTYTLLNNRIEASRSGLYMGAEGFKKGVQELQQFFQTTLGGGRW
ncbi:hypothetical protein COW36_11255 [bacterium (Candidatus Blackallbacteria) CG17_big_fil_post_rev_8_21_14_2_50_48_46]|uniref:Uncharacterized protein n=1 Tax=bacterium (Candidatus Blackallbacteria) CG17_big_fil_post_rev_8_21_14_2_50_48_46 TaxID=2014261 RepID=A0A2M7G4L1_9BACT|nr:MAG: hypothetical protein COW64_18350 [bacterium (Candidatus Blackallbacteria) CG18_big_fil_WC_8_21_14_2_50_49_26]PIW16852.1 MAG: hypothetical protein COW36_11255 [bacterium (Candidatus Blackallbacteria) CG17_big_fil_post_rev_8_21_14_2_50_48_46]PIW48049.1 MAG: hypothetical protein COW20_10970 [bacterium (Candidatus Blackallbacteria) CG13_big_fil_rev_8_21_14_2_50_49_14]